MRAFIVGIFGGAVCFITAFVVGLLIDAMFPAEGRAYIGIGFDSHNLPGYFGRDARDDGPTS